MAGGVIDAGGHGEFLAEIARQIQDFYLGVFVVNLAEQGKCLIVAAVVDANYLIVGRYVFQDRDYSFEEYVYHGLFVVHRYDDAEIDGGRIHDSGIRSPGACPRAHGRAAK